MGYEKDTLIEKEDNWHEYARRSGKRCAFCSGVLTYAEYTDLGGKCIACASATDAST